MGDIELIMAIKSGNRARIQELLDGGTDVNQEDEHGWTALNWVAGKGDCATLTLLLDYHADVFHTGRDLRTPAMIALAAGHVDAADLLLRAESAAGSSTSPARKYCAAFPVREFHRFAGWSAQPAEEDEIAFLHQNYVVTRSIWDNEDIIFDQVTEEWKLFCDRVLQFKVPDDLDLIAERQPVNSSSRALKAGVS